MADGNILMGVIGKPHGVRGLLHVHSFTADPADLARYNPMLPAEHEERVRLQDARILHWVGQGAVATDRVARFLGKAGLAPMPAYREQPVKSAPKKKAQERAKAAAAAG